MNIAHDMKIVLATPLYPPEIGGPATDSASLANHLPALGMEAQVVPFREVRHLPKGFRHLVYGWRLYQAARSAAAIVAFDTVSVGLPSAIVALLARRRLIVRVPGDYAWEQGRQRFGVADSIDEFQKKRYGLRVELLRRIQRFVVKRAVLVVAPSDYFKRIVVGWGVQPSRVMRIYLGVDLGVSAEAPRDIPEGKTLFSAGRLVPWKGFSQLVELVPQLPEAWHLVIAGDGPMRGALEARATELGISSRVTFLGAVSHEAVLGWLKSTDAFVLNTSFESFSFQIVEAMASGIPVIATTAGNIPELITDGVEGVLCEPNDAEAFRHAIMSVTDEPGLWKDRTAAAKEKAATFSLPASAAAFTAAIQNLCA